MTQQGVVFFAFNNDSTDYVKLAAWSARRVSRHLGVPCSLMTDRATDLAPAFDQVIICQSACDQQRWFGDSEQKSAWYNHDRYQVYELSPYDETLLLDADYVVCSDVLNRLWQHPAAIVCAGRAFDVTGLSNFDEHNWFGRFRMPSAWATVIKFRRDPASRAVFDVVQRVQNNWQHYRNLYGIQSRPFRNDFALAMAMNLVYGQTAEWPVMPWSMATVVPEHRLDQTGTDAFEVRFVRSRGGTAKVSLVGMDFHAMGKKHLENIIDNCY